MEEWIPCSSPCMIGCAPFFNSLEMPASAQILIIQFPFHFPFLFHFMLHQCWEEGDYCRDSEIAARMSAAKMLVLCSAGNQ